MYKMIHDEEELKWFYDNVVPPLKSTETYFVSLSARNKYLTDQERVDLELGRTEMFEKKAIKYRSWNKFLSTIRKFETAEGSYLTRNNSNIPGKSIVVYFNINPSNMLKAYRKFSTDMDETIHELAQAAMDGNDTDSLIKRLRKMDSKLMSCVQNVGGTRHWMDFDYDVPKDFLPYVEKQVKAVEARGGKAYIIDTKSGYHLLVRQDKGLFDKIFNPYLLAQVGTLELRDFLRDEKGLTTQNQLDEAMKKYEVIHNKDAMIPLPGTFQGGHPVTILNKD